MNQQKSKPKNAILKWLKRILFSLFGIVAILLLTLFGIFHLRKDLIKNTLINTVNISQNGTFTFSTMSLSPLSALPHLAINLDSVYYYENPADKSNNAQPIIALENADVALDIIKLIQGEVDIEEVYLYNGTINMIVYPDNLTNLEKALGLFSKNASENIPADQKTESSPPDFRLENVEISNVLLHFQHQKSYLESKTLIENLSASLNFSYPFTNALLTTKLQNKFFSIDERKLLLNKKIEISSEISLDEQEGIATVHHSSLIFNNLTTKIDGIIHFNNDSLTQLNFDASDQDLTLLSYLVEDEILDFNTDFLKTGDIELKGKISGFNPNRLPKFDASFAVKNLNLDFPDGSLAIDDLDVQGNFQTGDSTDFSEVELHIHELNGKLPGGEVYGTFKLSNFVNPTIAMKLKLDADLAGYDKVFKLEPLYNLAGNVHLNTNFSATLDPSDQKVVENIEHFKADIKNLTFSFPEIEHPFENITGSFSHSGNTLNIQSLDGSFATSKLQASGFVEKAIASLIHPGIELKGGLHLVSDRMVLNEMPFRKWLPEFFDAQTVDSFDVHVDVSSTDGLLGWFTDFTNLDLAFDQSIVYFDSLPDVLIDTAVLKIFVDPKIDTIVSIENLTSNVNFENGGSIFLENTYIKIDTQSVDIEGIVNIKNTNPNAFLRQMRFVSRSFEMEESSFHIGKITSAKSRIESSFQLKKYSFSPLVISNLQMDLQLAEDNLIHFENATMNFEHFNIVREGDDEILPGIASFAGKLQANQVLSNSAKNGSLSIKNIALSFNKKSLKISTDLEAQNIKPIAFLDNFNFRKTITNEQKTYPEKSEILNGKTRLETTLDLENLSFTPLNLRKTQFKYQFTDTTFIQLGKGDILLDKLTLADTLGSEIIPGVAFISGALEMEDIQSAIFTDMWLQARFNGSSDQFDIEFSVDEIPGADEKGSVTFIKFDNALEYQIAYNLKNYPIERMLNRFYEEEIMTGFIDIEIDASSKGKDSQELIKNAKGSFAFYGENMVLYGVDLDELLKRYKKSQNFNLIDLSAYMIVGPMGAVVTKGADFAKLLNVVLSSGEKTPISQLISSWEIKDGILKAKDVGFVTEMNRAVLHGSIDLPKDSIEIVTVSVVNKKGCSLISQSLWGKFTNLQQGKINVIGKLLGAVINVLEIVVGKNCEVIYSGQLVHPEKEKK